MRRTPTPLAEVYAWHRDALAGKRPAITYEVHAGFYKRKLVKGGPFVPARIWLHQETDPETGELVADEVYLCEVDGKRLDAEEQWTWLCSRPITEAEFNFMSADASWCQENAPEAPQANPRAPVASRAIPPLF